jgi:DNA-binding CsgD family transcriptional regulator
VVLAGLAGVGKTRLAREALAQAERAGCAVVWVIATRAAGSIPFGAFAHLIPDAGSTSRGLLELLWQASQALAERANGRRLVVGIDDAHLLDDGSAALVHQLAQTHAAFVIVTVRSGETSPDHVVGLWKDGLVERLEIHGLSEEDVDELTQAVLGGPIDGAARLRLWAATQGNVLFLHELIMGGLASASLQLVNHIWCWRGPMAVSGRLLDLIEARLGRLEAEESNLLEVVAHGEPIGARLLEKWFPEQVLIAVERRGLISVERDGRRVEVRLAHPLYGEALRAQTPLLRARAIHRQLVGALEATGARRTDDLLRIAVARLEAGDGGPLDLFIAAARRSLAAFGFALTERLACAAVEAGGGLVAHHMLALSLLNQGRHGEANVVLGGIDLTGGDEREQAMVTLLRAVVLYVLDRMPEAEDVLLQAERGISGTCLGGELRATHGALLLFSGQCQRATVILQDVLERYETCERACVSASAFAVLAHARAGRASVAAATVARWREPATRLAGELAFHEGDLFASQAFALLIAGRIGEAEGLAHQGYEVALRRHDESVAATWAYAMGEAALASGRVATAARWLREAATLCRASRVDLMPFGLGALAIAAALGGDVAGARAAIAEADSLVSPVRMAAPNVDLGRAWLAAALGELSTARAIALGAADSCEESGQYALACRFLHDVARLGGAQTAAPRLDRFASLVEGPLAPVFAAHAAALLPPNGIRLDDVSRSFERIGTHLLAAEAAAAAARAHRFDGRRASARAASTRARMLLERCEGARSPALILIDTPELTMREREVAVLAADGLSSPAIATRMALSSRTIETHLRNAYAKLGIHSRDELRSVAACWSRAERPSST